MKFWLQPKDEHIVYEALTAIADDRVEIIGSAAKVFSSSRNKFYTVVFDLEKISFMSDDNMAYYRDEVSYPMLAVLLLKNKITFDHRILPYLKNIPWKDINQKNKNDYMKSVREFLETLGYNRALVESEAKRIFDDLLKIKLSVLGEKVIPPKGY